MQTTYRIKMLKNLALKAPWFSLITPCKCM